MRDADHRWVMNAQVTRTSRSNRRLRRASDAKILDIFQGTQEIQQLIVAGF